MNCTATSRAPSQVLGSFAGQKVSARPIRRHLLQHGLSAWRPLFLLLLTLHHRQELLQWCDQRRTWMQEWRDVVFSDESRSGKSGFNRISAAAKHDNAGGNNIPLGISQSVKRTKRLAVRLIESRAWHPRILAVDGVPERA
ncbi:hypothetical protein LAZ67_9001009 [Cordylochernes scorpioides]|uniref:Transposase n=1 Tax=Cordylochernes scorpioides TaxID=51811 RepID=A0ABY6KTB5_9ARAC|nr:hypothetical protein LAZ67_9001009 [Cordylochernes scorpioides]